MKKKQLLVIAVLLALAIGAAAWAIKSNAPQSQEPQTQEEALEQARNYKEPGGIACAAVMTPALHEGTGTRYTFPTACIPEGWKQDSQ